jgi:hypothetical protein
MKLFKLYRRLIWVGLHKFRGIVIYEAAQQESTANFKNIILFVDEIGGFEQMNRDYARQMIIPLDESRFEEIAESYARKFRVLRQSLYNEHFAYEEESSRFISDDEYIIRSEFGHPSWMSEISDNPCPSPGSAPDYYESFLYNALDRMDAESNENRS